MEPHLAPLADVDLHLPFEVGDYVDFYASLDHATNVGRIFRPDGEPLTPELAAPADRLPRPLRHGRAQRYAGGAAAAASGRHRRTQPRRTARAGGSTSRPSSASWSVRRPRWPTRCRSTASPTTSSAWSGSTTGPRATSRRGSTCRSVRSSASRSPPRSRHWVTPLEALDAAWVDLPGQDPAPLPYLTGAAARGPRHRRRGGAQRRRSSAGRRTARCTGRRRRCSPT